MRPLARAALFVLFGALGCAGLGLGGFLKLQRDAEAAREARITELAFALPALRSQPTLSPTDACALAEHHVLTREISRALAVTCESPTFEARGPDAGKLTGLVWGRELVNALAGGGHAQGWCLARTAGGWEVIGDDWRVPDCVVDVSAGDAAAIAAAAKDTEAARQRAVAIDTIEAVGRALAAGGAPPAACADPRPEWNTTTITGATLAGRAPEGLERSFGYGTSGCVDAAEGAAAAEGAEAALPRGACALRERPDRVLVVDIDEVPPVYEGPDRFSGGRFDATLSLVDVPTDRVLCARPVAFALPEKVVTFESTSVQSEYDRGVKRAVCEGAEALGGVRLDGWWDC